MDFTCFWKKNDDFGGVIVKSGNLSGKISPLKDTP